MKHTLAISNVTSERNRRSSGMKNELRVGWGGAALGTVQNTFGGSTGKKEPGPESCAPGPRRAVPCGKANRGEASRLATDRPVSRSVRRIEPDIFILSLPHAFFSRFPPICQATAAVRKEEQPMPTSAGCERATQLLSPGQASDSSLRAGASPFP